MQKTTWNDQVLCILDHQAPTAIISDFVVELNAGITYLFWAVFQTDKQYTEKIQKITKFAGIINLFSTHFLGAVPAVAVVIA